MLINSPRKKVAFLGGGIHLIPNYRALLNKLCESYEVTLYSEFYIEQSYPVSYKIRTVSKKKTSQIIRFFSFLWLITKDHFQQPFHLFHCHSTFPSGLSGIVIGKLFHVPVIVSLNAAEASVLPEINFGDLLHFRKRLLNKWIINQADEVIVLTNFLLNEVRNNLKTQRPIHVIPRGINIKAFNFPDNPIQQPVRFLNVAYIHPVKDQETLIKCFAILSEKMDCILTLVGRDLSSGKIHQLVKSMDLEHKVKFEGSVSHEHIQKYYAQADMMLHTSRFESQAIVVNEAMASGVVVCGTDVGLLTDLSPECCITVKPGNAEGLANEVLKLLNKPDEIKRIRQNAYTWILQHDLDWTTEKHKEIYEKLW